MPKPKLFKEPKEAIKNDEWTIDFHFEIFLVWLLLFISTKDFKNFTLQLTALAQLYKAIFQHLIGALFCRWLWASIFGQLYFGTVVAEAIVAKVFGNFIWIVWFYFGWFLYYYVRCKSWNIWIWSGWFCCLCWLCTASCRATCRSTRWFLAERSMRRDYS